jgi:hypothetical protein
MRHTNNNDFVTVVSLNNNANMVATDYRSDLKRFHLYLLFPTYIYRHPHFSGKIVSHPGKLPMIDQYN